MHFLKFSILLFLFQFLGACSFNRVQFEASEVKPGMVQRQVKAEQKWCEIERQMALYADLYDNLWLSCPYRYEGRVVPSMSLISQKAYNGPTDFSHDDVQKRTRTMRHIALRNCGPNRWCADVSDLGFYDLNIQFLGKTAAINYTDLSLGRAAVMAFYAGLDGRPGALPLDPALKRLVKASEIDAKLEIVNSLEQLDQIGHQLAAVGLMDNPSIRYLLDQRRKKLQLAMHRAKGDFDGFQAAYQLSEEAADLERMMALALQPAQKSAVFADLMRRYQRSSSEVDLGQAASFIGSDTDRAQHEAAVQAMAQAKQAAQRQQEEARQAELRRQEQARQAQAQREQEARMAEQRAAQARADEDRCMQNPLCRAQVEQRRAQCAQTIQACRKQCDTATGAGSYGSFFGNLAAAGMARACYAGCKCDAGFGDILNKFNAATGKGK